MVDDAAEEEEEEEDNADESESPENTEEEEDEAEVEAERSDRALRSEDGAVDFRICEPGRVAVLEGATKSSSSSLTVITQAIQPLFTMSNRLNKASEQN